MRYAKVVEVAVAALIAMGAFSGSAAATSLTQAPPYTGTVKAESEGALLWGGSVPFTCQKSALEWNVETHGAALTASGPLAKFTLEECGKNTVTVVQSGSLELHATSGGNGTLTSTGAEITVLTHNILGTAHCIHKTNATDIGTLTGSATTGGTATLDASSSSISKVSTDEVCRDDAYLESSYKFTSPDYLYVD